MTQNADLILTLNEHHRYPSTDKNSASFSWPGGHGLAIYVAMNLEHFSFGCSEGAKISQVANSLDILNYSWRDYGNRVGGWHLAGLFENYRSLLLLSRIAQYWNIILNYCNAGLIYPAVN